MRHDHKRQNDSDLPAVTKKSQVEKSPNDERASSREGARELTQMRNRAIASTDQSERESLINEIQDRFGNQAAQETIASLRNRDKSEK